MYCAETWGIEWDWFACDQDGHVAIVSSGGSGQVPPILFRRAEAIQRLFDHLGLACDRDPWRLAAERGFFAYDVDINGGPFARRFVPRRPMRLDDVPEPHRGLIGLVRVRGRFAELRQLLGSMVEF